MDRTNNNFKPGLLFFAIIVIGIAARLLAATRGHNEDLDSYRIVAGVMEHGGNVYASTERYNYGPVWFHVLYTLDLLAGHNQTVFRYLLSGFLGLVDVGIFFILWRKFGKLVASFFFLNPVSVIITGYHSQFDNLAILLGLMAATLFGDEFDKPVNRRKFFGLLVLGISLATKHLLFAFPFWLAVKQKGTAQKFFVLLAPVAVFAIGFLPYWSGGGQGIIQNVFLYRSHVNEYFYHLFIPSGVQIMFNSQMIWLILLLVFAFIFRQKNTVESLFLYTCLLVGTSPSIANQYLAIPMAFVATHLNLFTILYTTFATLFLLVHVDALHFTGLIFMKSDDVPVGLLNFAVSMLCLALVWVMWRQKFKSVAEKCVFEVKNQFGRNK